MHNISKIISIFILLFITQNNLYANQKIAYVDINFIMNNSNIGIQLLQKLEKTNKENLKTLNDKKKKILEQKNEIENTKNILSKEELRKKINTQNKSINELNKIKKDLSDKINLIKQKEMEKIIQKINPLLVNFMKQNSIEILLRKESIYLSQNANDVTKNVLELINKNLK